MFRLHGENLYSRGLDYLVITKHALIFFYRICTRRLNINRSDLLNGAIGFFQPILRGIRRSNLVRRQVWPSAEAPSALLADLRSYVKSHSRLGLTFDLAVHPGK
jgi:hypothetical protein